MSFTTKWKLAWCRLFSIQVVTSVSRFNDGSDFQYVSIPATVVQEPLSGIEDKSVSTGGGGSVGRFNFRVIWFNRATPFQVIIRDEDYEKL